MDVGIFVADDPAKILAPVANETWIANLSTGQIAVFNGSGYTVITGGGGAVSQGPITTSGLTQATGKLLGRNTALTGAIEEITLGTNLSFSGTTLNAAGGGSGGLSLVQAQTLTVADDDITFSGLNGNADVMYRLMGVIKIGANTTVVDLRINGATTNQSWLRNYNGGSDTIANLVAASDAGQYLMIDLAIQAKANPNSQAFARMVRGNGIITTNAPALLFTIDYSVLYNDTSTNITSLNIHSDTATGLGNGSYLSLYKYAQT